MFRRQFHFNMRLFCLISFLSLNTCVAQEGGPKRQDIVECSTLSIPIAQTFAWSSGDVFVEMTDHFDSFGDDGEAGAVLIKKEYFRFVFDFEKVNFLQATIADGQGMFLSSNGNSEELRNSGVTAKILNGQERFFISRDATNRPRKSRLSSEQTKDVYKMLRALRMCDIRGCWMDTHLGMFFSNQPFSSKRKAWDLFSEGNNRKSSILDSVRKVSEFKFENFSQGAKFSTIIRLDSDHSMPVFFEKSVIPKGKSTKDLMGRTTFKWSKMNGLMVPKMFTVERAHSVKLDNEKSYGMLQQKVKFHWFSINEAVDQKLFSEKNVASRERVLSLLDPVLLGVNPAKESEDQPSPPLKTKGETSK